jgi:hypothetical protein
MDARAIFARIKVAAQRLTTKLRPKPPGMIGTPPSARKLSAIPIDPVEHARQFAREWEDVAETYVQKRMRELGIPEHQIGAIEYARGGGRRAFDPEGREGGTNDSFGRIYIDSGVLNPVLMGRRYGPEVALLWEKSPLPDKIDAVIAHELAEIQTGSHSVAETLAAETLLPIREGARHILRIIAKRVNPLGRDK